MWYLLDWEGFFSPLVPLEISSTSRLWKECDFCSKWSVVMAGWVVLCIGEINWWTVVPAEERECICTLINSF